VKESTQDSELPTPRSMKLQARDRAQLAVLALQSGLEPPAARPR
jgi:hypothetical protein